MFLMVEGIGVTQTNWAIYQKLYIADKCWLNIRQLQKMVSSIKLANGKLVNEMLWFHSNI